jgi:hypothetical protein
MNGFGSISQRESKAARKQRKEQEREWRKERHHDTHDHDHGHDRDMDDDDGDASPAPQVDPDDLQPEYDNRPDSQKTPPPKKIVDMTKVI